MPKDDRAEWKRRRKVSTKWEAGSDDHALSFRTGARWLLQERGESTAVPAEPHDLYGTCIIGAVDSLGCTGPDSDGRSSRSCGVRVELQGQTFPTS